MTALKLFLSGDVMTGRGIDQILPHPNQPTLHERYVKDAREYVQLAEQAHGSIPRPADFGYVWGVALDELDKRDPDFRIINLETSVTDSDEYWDGKGIHYRMNPDNLPCLNRIDVDLCVLANNHVLDFGPSGLTDTLGSLRKHDIETVGAGENLQEARMPATFHLESDRRLFVMAACSTSSGVPDNWSAGEQSPGVHLLDEISEESALLLAELIESFKSPDDRLVLSLHWGGNWGYEIPDNQRTFARTLIDSGTVDLVHGHSSHHVKGFEVYHDRLILYGCGDLLTDYEGIRGHENYRDDLGLMYFPVLTEETGQLEDLVTVPTKLQNFSLQRPGKDDRKELEKIVNNQIDEFGLELDRDQDGAYRLRR